MTFLSSIAAATTTTTTTAKKPGTSIFQPIYNGVAWVLAHIYAIVPNYALAIIILSVLWMVIISPLTLKSTRSMLAMQKLQPQLKKLQEKHKDDKQAFAAAQMELFREHKVSPFGSCLPMILPFPVFLALYRVISGLDHVVNGVVVPKYIPHGSRMFHDIQHAHGAIKSFGVNLALEAFSHHSSFWAALPYFILLVILAGTGYLQSAQMMSRNPAASQNPQMRMMKYLPIFFTVIFIRFPAGVLLYYATSNVCRIIQQDAMYRFDPKVKALVAQEVEEVETITHDIDEKRPSKAITPPRSELKQQQPSGGRSRFRDLLAAAAEQQQQRSQQKPGGRDGPAKKAGAGGTPSNGSSASSGGGTNGKKPGQPGKPAAGGSRPAKGAQGGHRTNRKKRRR